MSITTRQISLVQNSFRRVEPISEQAAEIFYRKLFEYDPNLRSLFKGDLNEQGRKLMATLKVAVNGASNIEKLTPVLHQLADRHLGYGVQPKDYTPVGNALLFALKTGLGNDFTPELRRAWVDTFRLIATVMKDHAYG